MGATFTTTGDWQGAVKGGYQTADAVAGLPPPQSGYIYRRKRIISDRYRNGQGLTSYTNDSGSAIAGDDLVITNGADSTYWGGEPNYIITANDLIPDPPGSGMWRETLVAEGYTAWEEWEIPT